MSMRRKIPMRALHCAIHLADQSIEVSKFHVEKYLDAMIDPVQEFLEPRHSLALKRRVKPRAAIQAVDVGRHGHFGKLPMRRRAIRDRQSGRSC